MNVLEVLNAPWAITQPKLDQIVSIYDAKLKGENLSVTELEAKLGRSVSNEDKPYEVIDGVAVISVSGVMAKRFNLFQAISGGVSTEMLGAKIQQALDDDDAHSIILDIDSPGGSVDGTPELANIIFEGREQKNIIAYANGLMASAGYWIGSACNEVYSSSVTTQVGSIGVVAQHVDVSKADKQRGVKRTEIYAGKYKRIASSYEPLTEDGRASIQDQVDYLYSIFVGTVSKHRGVSEETVLSDMADARVFIGQQAVDAGLVDGITTLDALIAKLSSAHNKSASTYYRPAAETQTNQPQDMNMEKLTLEILKKDHPDLVKQIHDSAHAEGYKEGKGAGIQLGVTDELKRVKAVFGQTMAGHEDLVKTLAFDGKTTGPEAAVAILNAENAARNKVAADLEDDAPDAAEPDASEEAEDSEMSATEMAKLATDLQASYATKGIELSASDAVAKIQQGERA